MRLIFIIIISNFLFKGRLLAQSEGKQWLHFERGQASISLSQLDSIKSLAKAAMAKSNGRIVVRTYANDALEGDLNARLSGRRAYLVQQCLERAGMPLGHLQIENKVYPSNTTDCPTCAEITVTTDSNFFSQNIYQDHVADFLLEESGVIAQTFWVEPFKNVLVTTKDGVLVQIPAGTLATSDSGMVKLEVRYLKNSWEMLLHSLVNRSIQQEFLEINRAVHLSAAQYGKPLKIRNGKNITVVVPSDRYTEQATVYTRNATSWKLHPQSEQLRVGSFYIGTEYWCNKLDKDGLALPNFETPPVKPKPIPYQTATVELDKALKDIQIRLDYLEEQKVDAKGKTKALNAQQRRNEHTLKNRKNRLLIAKEKVKIQTREKNEAMEADYYKMLAVYNKARNNMQQSYISDLEKAGITQRANQNRCAELKANEHQLKADYGQALYEQIVAHLRNQTVKHELGYWTQTNQLGWLSVGCKAQRATVDAVPFRVTSPTSAYKVTAFLILEDTQDIVLGETLDATDIVFWEVPDGKAAKLLAVTQEGDNFLIAFHHLTTSGNPIELNFKNISLSEVLGTLK
ncbi:MULTISPECIES: hypothetical protein [unclassified Aureispira]|uniref:hypothetical protein n=1 Tax=unclassified Aureispira TaxID=2649989 RepID=UPI0006965CDF|nr:MULTISPECIES: hypothetical protein [unclassified Aureispira]WMX14651.1 hypothetical protein QP953_27715 [Aureispira sp. CCB-E]